MFRLTVVCVLAIFLASAGATNVKQCKNGKPQPISVNIEGCEQPPCNVYKGSTAVMEVRFASNKSDVKKLTATVQASVFGVVVPYPLPEDVANVCQNLMNGANCPLQANDDVVYKFNFYVDPIYPEIAVGVQLSLVDEQGDSLACFVVNCRVRKSKSAQRANRRPQIA